MRRAPRALLSVLATVPFLVGGPALAQGPTPVPVLDVEWTLTQLDGEVVPADPAITATFASDGSLTGSGGCNRYSATWASDTVNLSVTNLRATLAACSADVDARESRYLELLQEAATWTLDGEAVVVTASSGATLVYGGDSEALTGLQLVGTWPLATLGGEAPPTGMSVTIDFAADGLLTGVACNDYSATYTATETGDLSVEPIAATRRSCGGAADAFQGDYLNGLQGATSWATQGGQLLLSGAADLVFGDGASGDVTLAGQEWLLTSLGGAPMVAGSGISASFGEDGTVTGSGGCNRFTGPYTADGESLAVGPLAATRMSCGITADDLESTYLSALEAAESYSISGIELVVSTTSGITLEFSTVAGPVEPVETTTPAASAPVATPVPSAAPATPVPSAAPATPVPSAAPATPVPSAAPATPVPSAAPVPSSRPAASGTVGDDAIVGSWRITGFLGQSLPGNMLAIDITFAADGTFAGFGGCNDYSGQWSLDGTRLTVSGFESASSGTCDQMTQGIEQTYFALVPFLDTAEVGAEGSLSLRSALVGGEGFVFAPAD